MLKAKSLVLDFSRSKISVLTGEEIELMLRSEVDAARAEYLLALQQLDNAISIDRLDLPYPDSVTGRKTRALLKDLYSRLRKALTEFSAFLIEGIVPERFQ